MLLFLLMVLRIAGLVRQVEEQAAQLAALARRDGLTGMPNRRAWEGELPSHAPWLVELPGVVAPRTQRGALM